MSTKFNRRHFIAAGSAAAAAPFLLRRASAQGAWPSRQICMVCSYPAGGQTDLLARGFGDYISRQVGKTVVIENKAGASGSIGAAEVARGAGWPHHPVLDLHDFCDEPGHDEEPRLRHGQGSDPRQRHPGRRAAAGRQPEIRHQVAGRLRRLRAQERQDEFWYRQRGLIAAHHDQRTQQAIWSRHRADPLPRRSADVDWRRRRHARCRDGQLHRRAIRPAKQRRRCVRGAFEEGRRDPRYQDPARAGRDLEILHRERLLGLGPCRG